MFRVRGRMVRSILLCVVCSLVSGALPNPSHAGAGSEPSPIDEEALIKRLLDVSGMDTGSMETLRHVLAKARDVKAKKGTKRRRGAKGGKGSGAAKEGKAQQQKKWKGGEVEGASLDLESVVALAKEWAAALEEQLTGGAAEQGWQEGQGSGDMSTRGGTGGGEARQKDARRRRSTNNSLLAAAGAGDVNALGRWFAAAAEEAGGASKPCVRNGEGQVCSADSGGDGGAGTAATEGVREKMNAARNSRGESALMVAARHGHHKVVARLMAAGANTSVQLPTLGSKLERRSLQHEGRSLPTANTTGLGLVLLPDGDRALSTAIVDAPRRYVTATTGP